MRRSPQGRSDSRGAEPGARAGGRGRSGLGAGIGLLALLAAACQNEVPTIQDPDLVPVEPVTVEVLLPAAEFLTAAGTAGGFGSTNQLFAVDGSTVGFLAHRFSADSLEARTLVRFLPAPSSVTVQDSTGASVTDTILTPIGAFLVGRVDTLASVYPTDVQIEVGRLDQLWDASSATWEYAVDTLGLQRPWDEEGAGPVQVLTTGAWDISETADTFRIPLDTATLRVVMDTTTMRRGLRLASQTPATRLRISDLRIEIEAQPSVNPDTTVSLIAGADDFSGMTFIYDPVPAPVSGDLRVGGAPAWRTRISVQLPQQLTGPPSLCAVVTCPVQLNADELSSAQLLLTTRTSPLAFQPRDSISIAARELLAPATFPRSPVGSLLTPSGGLRISGPAFGASPGQQVAVSITPFIQALIADTAGTGEDALVLLSPVEPSSLEFMTFAGLGSTDAPVLRLVLTLGGQVDIR